MKTRLWFISFYLLLTISPVRALQITDQFSIDWLSAGAVQCGNDNSELGYSWICRGGAVTRPEFTFSPTEQDSLGGVLGFAAGNALNNITPFNLQPWNADLESVVKHINGQNRSFILTAHYAHTFSINDNNSITATGGIIDSTEYFVTNEYANDEYVQFMSGPLSFGQNVVLPSYDYGAVVQWFSKKFTVTSLYMNVGKNTSNTNQFNYFATQILFKVNTAWGKGHYRFMVDATDKTFTTINNLKKADRLIMASFDQEFGPVFGGWVRFGQQSRDLVGTFAHFYSGGIHVKGTPWGREDDSLGIGAVHVTTGSNPFKNSFLLEAYYRCVVNNYVTMTPDIQFQTNNFEIQDALRGVIVGLRSTITV